MPEASRLWQIRQTCSVATVNLLNCCHSHCRSPDFQQVTMDDTSRQSRSSPGFLRSDMPIGQLVRLPENAFSKTPEIQRPADTSEMAGLWQPLLLQSGYMSQVQDFAETLAPGCLTLRVRATIFHGLNFALCSRKSLMWTSRRFWAPGIATTTFEEPEMGKI